MKSGKLGVVVLMVAIIGAIAGSWIMSMDVIETSVTKYNPLVDITSEFQTEKTPDYVDYSPSTNYTGYYTQDSIIGDTTYFDGVDYAESSPNNYRLNLPPLVYETETYDLRDFQSDRPLVPTLMLRYASTNNNTYSCTPDYTSVASLYLQLGQTLDELRIYNLLPVDEIEWLDPLNGRDWITFVYPAMFEVSSINYDTVHIKNPSVTGEIDGGHLTWYRPILACVYDTKTQIVQLYYDTDLTESAGAYNPSEVLLLWDAAMDVHSINLSHYAAFAKIDLQDPEYMDPSKGVALS